MPRLLLINPDNPLVSLTKDSYTNQWRVWKPLGLLVLAGPRAPGRKARARGRGFAAGRVMGYDAGARIGYLGSSQRRTRPCLACC